MGAKASTPASTSGSGIPPVSNGHDRHQRELSSSLEAELGILRSASQEASGGNNISSSSDRARTRSLSSVPAVNNGNSMSIPGLLPRGPSNAPHSMGGASSETEGSSPEDYSTEGPLFPFGLSRVLATHSLPAHLWSFNGFKCPVCSKLVLTEELECHLVICLTKPRIVYNEDVLSEDKGECVICLEDLCQGDTIARLPCLCIYHKTCIDQWFQVNRSCPEHPYD